MKLDDFDYNLPRELIAVFPPENRAGARLLVLEPAGGYRHRKIVHLPGLLPEGALLVANDTRVIKARIRGRRPSGGAVEVLLVRMIESGETTCRWRALTRANKPIKVGHTIDLKGLEARVVERGNRGDVVIEVNSSGEGVLEHAESQGEIPLPPYIRRDPVPEDQERYQTVYARYDGSVAAPTAGLHFTPELLHAIEERGIEIAYVTLHVGPGTFRPITGDEVETHEMDSEEYVLSRETAALIAKAKEESRPIIAVGTTVARALEGAHENSGCICPGRGFTELFIYPGFKFNVIDGLLTNFHLPRSTLLCLVSALAGQERIMNAYREAVLEGYRFYSYGDAMLILPKSS